MMEQVMKTTEAREHNGQCGYGPWELLCEIMPRHVGEAIADEILECMSRDMRGETDGENTDDYGIINIGGRLWEYRR